VNPRALAVGLGVLAAAVLWAAASTIAEARERRSPRMAASAAIGAAVMTFIFINSAIDLWRMT
jgi:hypothetical protein